MGMDEFYKLMKNRILVLANVHAQLLEKPIGESVDMGEYLRDLSTFVLDRLTISIKLKSDMETCKMDTDHAVPVGFIVNEIMTLIVKNVSFAGIQKPEVYISLKATEAKAVLTISDNGNQLMVSSPSISAQLLELFVDQLDGQDLTSENPKYRLYLELPLTNTNSTPVV